MLLERARVASIAAVLGAYGPAADRAPLAALLDDAWRSSVARREADLVDFGTTRTELTDRLGCLDESALGAVVRAAPSRVRRAMLEAALAEAGRLETFKELGVPAPVLEGTRRNLRELVVALDPASPMVAREPPSLVEASGNGAGPFGVNLHAWLERVLECACDPAGLLTFRGEASSSPSASTPAPTRPMRPGVESTAYSVTPSRAVWLPPEVALPRLLDDGDVVVGEAGGPLTYAFAGDAVGAEVDPRIGARVAGLRGDEVLLSFLWRETSVDIAWSSRAGR